MTDPTPETTPTRDEAVPFPAYGELPFSELGSAVKAAQFGAPEPYEFDPEFYPGHQIVGTINFNSLNRIVTWFVKRALASAPAPASGRVDAVGCYQCGGDGLVVVGWDEDAHENIEGPCPECAKAASLSPAATPVYEAEQVAIQHLEEMRRVVRLYCDHDKMTDAEKVSAIANHPYFASSALENRGQGLAGAHSKNPPEAEHG